MVGKEDGGEVGGGEGEGEGVSYFIGRGLSFQ